MKIKLILAASGKDPLRKNDPFMPLSLPILADASPDHDYTFVDLLWEDDVGYDETVDLVGISMRHSAESAAFKIADEFRRRKVPVVLGGPQASAVPHRAILHADAVAVGEAEELWPAIVDDAQKGELKKFYVCSPQDFDARGQALHQVRRYPEPRLTSNRHLYKKKYVFDTVYAMRGCHINCDFCSVTEMFGSQYRSKPVQDVIKEINSFRNYYYLIDDTVFGRPHTYDYYLELYEAIADLKKRRFWTGQGNLDAASDPRGRDVIQKAAESGLLYAAIGMESINPATLSRSGAMKKMGVDEKFNPIERMKENIRFIQDQGIIVSGWFVIGYEDDDIDTYYRTMDFCSEMKIIPVIFPVKALPGTRLYHRLEKEKKLDDSKFLNFRHPDMDDREIFKALKSTAAEGYSMREIMARTLFYLSRFKGERIHKTIFALVLQSKIKIGIDMSSNEFIVPDSTAMAI